MIDPPFDWTSWVAMLIGSAVSIYAQVTSKRRWIGIAVPFGAALALVVVHSILLNDRPFEFEFAVVLGILFLIIGSVGASQWRRTNSGTQT
jgi:hypothetical protein